MSLTALLIGKVISSSALWLNGDGIPQCFMVWIWGGISSIVILQTPPMSKIPSWPGTSIFTMLLSLLLLSWWIEAMTGPSSALILISLQPNSWKCALQLMTSLSGPISQGQELLRVLQQSGIKTGQIFSASAHMRLLEL